MCKTRHEHKCFDSTVGSRLYILLIEIVNVFSKLHKCPIKSYDLNDKLVSFLFLQKMYIARVKILKCLFTLIILLYAFSGTILLLLDFLLNIIDFYEKSNNTTTELKLNDISISNSSKRVWIISSGRQVL